MAELNFRRASGDLVPLEDVRIELRRICAALAARLHSIPPRLGGAAEGRDASEIEQLTAEMIDQALDEFQHFKLPGAPGGNPE